MGLAVSGITIQTLIFSILREEADCTYLKLLSSVSIIKPQLLYYSLPHLHRSHRLTDFYRAALNEGPSGYKKAVCSSVSLFVKRVECDKTEKKICPDFYTMQEIT